MVLWTEIKSKNPEPQRLPHVSLKWFMVQLCVVCPVTAVVVVVVVHRFYIYIYIYIALFSALKQNHCALVACD